MFRLMQLKKHGEAEKYISKVEPAFYRFLLRIIVNISPLGRHKWLSLIFFMVILGIPSISLIILSIYIIFFIIAIYYTTKIKETVFREYFIFGLLFWIGLYLVGRYF